MLRARIDGQVVEIGGDLKLARTKAHDIEAVIPYKTNEKGRRKKFNRKGYRRRNIIERCVSSLKWFRRVATRYEKLAIHYLGMVTLAIIFRLL